MTTFVHKDVEDNPVVVWVVDLLYEDDYRQTNAKFFMDKANANKFKEELNEANKTGIVYWVATDVYSISREQIHDDWEKALEDFIEYERRMEKNLRKLRERYDKPRKSE